MPKLSDTLQSQIGTPKGYAPVETSPPQNEPIPVNSTFPRCPLPPIWTTNQDALGQFELNGRVPQQRIYARNIAQ